ncbi:MAG: alpha-E domain-containing protein [Lachnospiraceae bacterium]|nr:alpha-E domain-containing protein [Lachnospiraceae bacterium]
MGVISLDRADSLFWLGRYTERVFTTVKVFFQYYDKMIDQNENAYQKFCMELSIPDVYGSRENFVRDYILDETNPDSIISNMKRAYDNALVSRDDVSTESMAYLELCLQAIRRGKGSAAPLFELQSVIDDIYAFWGSIDDCILDEENRNIVKCGRYVERMDLYLRLGYGWVSVAKEFAKFSNRLERVRIGYHHDKFQELTGMINRRDEYEELRRPMLMALQGIF